MIGCAEYVSPSNPAKAYRRVEDSGSATSDFYSDSGCTMGGAAPSVTCVYTGFRQYDAITGMFTTGGATICNGSTISTGEGCGKNGNSCDAVWTFTQTTQSRMSTGLCCPSGSIFSKESADTLVITLSDEDVEADAILRLLAGAGGTWTAWTATGDGTGGTCIPSSCCLAQYEQRTTSFSFQYQEAQFRVAGSGLTPSTTYTVKVDIWRRTYGTGMFTHYSTLTYSETTDGSGNFTFDDDVPNAVGFETYAASAVILP